MIFFKRDAQRGQSYMGIISIEQKELRIKGGNILSNVERRRSLVARNICRFKYPWGFKILKASERVNG